MIRARAVATIFIAAAMSALVSCDRPSQTASDGGTGDSGKGSQQNAAFGAGFHKEEVTPNGNIRWVRQEATMTLNVPAAGNYRLSFKPVTVFVPTPVSITIAVNDQPPATITAQSFDFATAPMQMIEVPLRAGANTVTLKADRPEVRLSENDARTAAFGLVLPVGAGPLP
jgi:hypothetical protein